MEEKRKSYEAPAVDAGRASDESLIRVHAQLRRTPVPGSAVTFFTAMALIVVLIFGWFYHRRYIARVGPQDYLAERMHREGMQAYLSRSQEPAGPAQIDAAALYAQQCSACHQANGQGLAGAFPPLSGSEWVTGDPELPIKVVLSGLSGPVTVAGQSYNGAMPGFGAVFSDAQVAAIVSYIRTSWDNDAGEVTEEQVAQTREASGSRGPWTAGELQEHF